MLALRLILKVKGGKQDCLLLAASNLGVEIKKEGTSENGVLK